MSSGFGDGDRKAARTLEVQKMIKDAFALFDKDSKGVCDVREVGTVVRHLGICPTEIELRDMITEIEEEEPTGFIRFEKFERMMSRILLENQYPRDSEDKLLRAFRTLDPDNKGYIDQHYYAIAEKSTLTSGKDLPVDAAKFEGAFEEKWETVVAEGRAFNALEFSKNFAQFQEAGALDTAWDATSVDKKTRVKLGGGFYCGQIEVEGVKNYTFNAFFMS